MTDDEDDNDKNIDSFFFHINIYMHIKLYYIMNNDGYRITPLSFIILVAGQCSDNRIRLIVITSYIVKPPRLAPFNSINKHHNDK